VKRKKKSKKLIFFREKQHLAIDKCDSLRYNREQKTHTGENRMKEQ
jgi:hypothetical protein